jgi:hypothetical protein
MKVLVFEWESLKAALYWCKQFQDLIELKSLDDTNNESNDGQDTYILNQSNDNASNNEF